MRLGVRGPPLLAAICALSVAQAQAQTTPPLTGIQLEDAVEAATSDGLSRELSPTPIVRSVTIIWIGRTKRTVAGELSMLIHVDWPSNARGDAAQFAGYSVEVVVSIDQAGRWKNTRANTFIAG